jgi:hypothetical protein
LLAATCSEPEAPLDLADALAAIDGMTVEEVTSPVAGYRAFVLAYRQPADHGDPDGVTFEQRMTLLHRDADAPLVLQLSGYWINTEKLALREVATMTAANQLTVEHRFFPPSRPSPANWGTLKIAQAAADNHRIAEALRPLYPGPWLASGGSKGGMAALYYRRFFPDDVDATIAYVAPHSDGILDPRYLGFVEQLGAKGCGAALKSLQREILLRRPAMLERMRAVADAEGYSYDLIGEDRALESAVIELPFTFWQYSDASACAEVPGETALDDEVWEFFEAIDSPVLWSDDGILSYEPYYFQAGIELGYPAYDESNVADLIMFPGLDVPATYVPSTTTPAHDPAAMADVSDWLAREGEAILFIYGENDPYSAAPFEPGEGRDALRFFVPGQNHGAAIADLPPAEREQALAAIERWTGVAPVLPETRSASVRRGRFSEW